MRRRKRDGTGGDGPEVEADRSRDEIKQDALGVNDAHAPDREDVVRDNLARVGARMQEVAPVEPAHGLDELRAPVRLLD